MNAAQTIIQALLDAPDDFKVKGILGTGPFARRFNKEHGHYKIIVPDDSKQNAMYMIHLLLHDLSVDLHLSDEVRSALANQFEGGKLK